jgi:DNA-binding MarR family transcriptional regulator
LEKISFVTINNIARKKLGLSFTEYALVDLVYHLSNNPDSYHPGWCYATKDKLAAELDVKKRQLFTMINKMINAGLIERHPETSDLRVSKNWYQTVLIRNDSAIIARTVQKLHDPTVQLLHDDSAIIARPIKDDKDIDKDIKNDQDFGQVFEQLWKDYPRREGKKGAELHFKASVKKPEDVDRIKKALINYKASDNVVEGLSDQRKFKFIQTGKTWFNNWEDWEHVAKPKTAQEQKEDGERKLREHWLSKGLCKYDGSKVTEIDGDRRCDSCGRSQPRK